MAVRKTFLRTHRHHAHHRHTIIFERDPEIVTPAPSGIAELVMNIFMTTRTLRELRHIVIHSCGGLSAQDRERGRTAVPEGAAAKARLWIVIMTARA